MIESSSRIIRLLQNSKSVTLPVLYLLFAALFFYAGVFSDNARINHGHSTSSHYSYLLTQNSDLRVAARIISYNDKPYPDDAISTGPFTTHNTVDLVQKAYAAGKRGMISADGKHAESIPPPAVKGADRSSLARNLVSFMLTWGAEGIHLDWRPPSSFFEPKFFSIMTDFRSTLDTISPKPLLTTAATWGILTVRPALELLQPHQNRNSMITNELSAPWPGPVICRDTSSM